MKRLKIDGTPKRRFDYCALCRNGKDFTQEQYFKTDSMGYNYKTHICEACLTKYYQPYIKLDFDIENFIAEDISMSDFREWNAQAQSDGRPLSKLNASYHAIAIGLKMKQVRTMLMEEIEEYKRTGVCTNHNYNLSHPFKTAEGKFQLECCPICKEARINYKNITYKDNIMNIVRFIAHQGIEFEKAQKKLPEIDWKIESEKSSLDIDWTLPDLDWTISDTEVKELVW